MAVVVDEDVVLDWVLFLMMKMGEWRVCCFSIMLMMGMPHASVLFLLLLMMRTTMIWGGRHVVVAPA